MYIIVVAYFSTLVKPFPMFYSNKREVNDNKKLLAEIIPSMQNQPHSKNQY